MWLFCASTPDDNSLRRLIDSLFVNKTDVSFVFGGYLRRDLDECSFFHTVCPIRVATEGKPIETRRYPFVVKDKDLRVSICQARQGEALRVLPTQIGEPPEGVIVRTSVIVSDSVGNVNTHALQQPAFEPT